MQIRQLKATLNLDDLCAIFQALENWTVNKIPNTGDLLNEIAAVIVLVKQTYDDPLSCSALALATTLLTVRKPGLALSKVQSVLRQDKSRQLQRPLR